MFGPVNAILNTETASSHEQRKQWNKVYTTQYICQEIQKRLLWRKNYIDVSVR